MGEIQGWLGDGAAADHVDALDAGLAQYLAAQPGQVEMLAVADALAHQSSQGALGAQGGGRSLHHLGTHFKRSQADAGAHGGHNSEWGDPHGGHGGFDDPAHGPAPARMDGGDDAAVVDSQQDWRAVGSADANAAVPGGGDDGISLDEGDGRAVAVAVAVDDRHAVAMDLAGAKQGVLANAHLKAGAGQVLVDATR